MKRDFKGVWIPKEIWLSKELSLQEKLFLVEIDSLDNEDGCYASNDYFADFFGLSKNRCSEVIKSLEKKGILTINYHYKKGTKSIEKRLIKVVGISIKGIREVDKGIRETDRGIREVDLGYSEKCEENNTSFNNTNNNTFNNKETVELIFQNYASGVLLEMLNEFKDFRKEVKSPITVKAAKMITKKLDSIGKDDFERVKIIEQSIENGYKGLFPLKSSNSYSYNKNISQQDPMAVDMSYLDKGMI